MTMRRVTAAARLLVGARTAFLEPFWGSEENDAFDRAIAGGRDPDALDTLRGRIAERVGSGWYVVLTSSGRAAILLALRSAKLPPGSEVVLPSFACTGVIAPVLQAGLRPVLVDVDAHLNVVADSIAGAEGPDVRAVIIPHLGGAWARSTPSIVQWARSRDIFVIEDAAQAEGLHINGTPAGTSGDVGVFSTGAGKMLFGPGGGWLLVKDRDLADALDKRLMPAPSVSERERLRAFDRRYRGSRVRRTAVLTRRFDIREPLPARRTLARTSSPRMQWPMWMPASRGCNSIA
jgi:selenocysteine lyase/cysteine desulfurase